MFQFLRFGYEMTFWVQSTSTVQVLAVHGGIVGGRLDSVDTGSSRTHWGLLGMNTV